MCIPRRLRIGIAVVIACMLSVLLLGVVNASVQSWTYMRRVGANNTNPGCGAISPSPYFCQDGAKFWAGYSVYNWPAYGESAREIYAGTKDTASDGGLWWGAAKAQEINWNITNNTGWYPAINLDEQGWNGGLRPGLDVQWMSTSLPNPSVPRRQDDNGDGRYEEVRVWARATILDNYRYYAYALFYDPDAWVCCNPNGASGQINYSAYRVNAVGDHALYNGTRWLGQFFFTNSFAPSFRCTQNDPYPTNCVQ